MKRMLIAALVAVCGCTPAQTRAWLTWWQQDPGGAVAFLETDTGRSLLEDPAPAPTVARLGAGAPGNCANYHDLFAAHGLPVATFARIAWRESGCNHRSFVIDRDDSGGGLLGINLKGSLAARWHAWCGVTLATVTDADTNIACAAAAYQRMGLAPWR